MNEPHVNLSLTVEQLWQFSLQYYSVKRIKEACLSLQNNFSGNVNLLLLLKYMDELQLSITEPDLSKLLASIIPTDNLIVSYRELRKSIKPHLPGSLYRDALQFELQLEKQQQADLVVCVNQFSLTSQTPKSLVERYCISLNAEHLIQVFNDKSIK